MRPQHNEKTYRLCMSYSLTSMSCASGVSIPYFKITAPLYPASPSFPKNISTPRLGKHIVRHTINYHPSPWRLTSLTNINNRIGIIVKCICGSKKKKKKEIIHFYSCSPRKTLLKVLIIGPLPTPIPQV